MGLVRILLWVTLTPPCVKEGIRSSVCWLHSCYDYCSEKTTGYYYHTSQSGTSGIHSESIRSALDDKKGCPVSAVYLIANWMIERSDFGEMFPKNWGNDSICHNSDHVACWTYASEIWETYANPKYFSWETDMGLAHSARYHFLNPPVTWGDFMSFYKGKPVWLSIIMIEWLNSIFHNWYRLGAESSSITLINCGLCLVYGGKAI